MFRQKSAEFPRKHLPNSLSSRIFSFISYEELCPNSKSSPNYIREQLSNLDLLNTVLILSKLNLLLSDDKLKADPHTHDLLNNTFLSEYYKNKLNKLANNMSDPKIIFNRHQLLLLQKYALISCASNSATDFSRLNDRNVIGTCGVVANGLLHLLPEPMPGPDLEDSLKLSVWKELLPTYEICITPDLAHAIARNSIILNDIIPGIPRRALALDINAFFKNSTNISIDEYGAVVFALIALCIKRREEIKQNPQAIYIDVSNMTAQTKIDVGIIDTVLNMLSLPLDAFRERILASKDVNLHYSFLILNQYPLVRLPENRYICLDLPFLIEKLITGIFWQISNKLDKSEAGKFHASWGNIFEEYVKAFFNNQPELREKIFIPNPKYISEHGEVADGILDYGSDVVLLEFKYANLPNEAKRSASIEDFIVEIKLKYEKNSAGEWKGYGQLANSIKRIFSRECRSSCESLKIDNIRRLFPVLVTWEIFLNSPMTNYFFNKYFQELIGRVSLIDTIQIMPLTIIPIEDLEASQPFLLEINKLLQDRIERDPLLYLGFSEFLKKRYRSNPTLNADWIRNEYHRFGEETRRLLFDQAETA